MNGHAAQKSINLCHICGSDQLVTVTFEVDGSTVIFRTCPPCEARWWARDGIPIERDLAIPMVTAA
jgi:hypothetical protein